MNFFQMSKASTRVFGIALNHSRQSTAAVVVECLKSWFWLMTLSDVANLRHVDSFGIQHDGVVARSVRRSGLCREIA